MKFDAEYNETTPAIVFNRFHEKYEIVTKMTSTVCGNPMISQTYLKYRQNEDVESKRDTSLDILIILNLFLPDSVNDKS